MRRGGLGLALLLSACAPAIIERPAPGAAGPPAARRHYRFRVQATTVPNKIRHDLGLAEIARLPGALLSGLRTQGLTVIKHSMATHTRFSAETGGTTVSAWFDDVILEVAIDSVTIYVPREYPVGSCEYRCVLEHEGGHGRAAREQAVALADRLERKLRASEGLATYAEPVVARDYESAAAALKTAIATIVDPVYERYEADERAVQAALDRPDPYDAVYRRCRGWK